LAPAKTLLHKLFHFWVIDLIASFVNFSVLTYAYEPIWGGPISNQVGMSTRIVYIFVIAFFMVRSLNSYNKIDLLQIGVMWMSLWLVFEWGGSLLTGRTVAEILVGWNVFAGYMWPFVLLAYLISSLIVGTIMGAKKDS